MTASPLAPSGAAAETVGLTACQSATLADIASPDPATGRFPPRNTVKALIRRGLVRAVEVAEPHNLFEMLMGRHVLRLEVTDAGRAALSAVAAATDGGRG